MSEDRILFRRNVGPFVSKDLLREKMTPEDAHSELLTVMGMMDEIKDHEDSIANLKLGIHAFCVRYNLGGLNNLLAFLTNKSGVKIKKKKEKDKK